MGRRHRFGRHVRQSDAANPSEKSAIFGSNDLQKVDHEDHLYEPTRAAIYDPVNQAASILGLPFEYTTSQGMSWCPIIHQ